MIKTAIGEAARLYGTAGDVIVEISIPCGEEIAKRTLNARLGIIGGLSILGTTGIVVPFSCAAWIDTIHRGIDVARAAGLDHVAGSTGSTSEAAVKALHGLPEIALIEMGDFAGGMLKYLRRHAIPKVTIAGGYAKMTKLGQGLLDLHSKRGEVDLPWLAARCAEAGATMLLSRALKRRGALGKFWNSLARKASISRHRSRKQPGARRRGLCMAAAFRLKSRCSTAKAHLLARTPFLPVH